MEGTEALRGAAARWTLAGDQQLLDLLQEIHQRIISKCNDTNKRLEEMSRGLRDASVNLQNVNNKFLALSNTQFVESRVYEDDTDVAPPVADREPPKAKELASELSKLKESLRTLEGYHEPLLIVGDSDSDSDDNDDRLVLKPKDLYADRPLPYIIGSQPWKTKWHAGLVPDESDSDSSTSKVEEVEQYSDSEEEIATAQDFVPVRKVSTDSSSVASSPLASPVPAPAPAAVAAELARRLGGDVKIPEREPVYTQPETVVRKLYKPQEPLATTIFPDEPPPLDETSSDDDIFAELHKSQPKQHNNRVDDLFDFNAKPSGLEEALFGPPRVQSNESIDKPPLFPEDSEPEVTVTPTITPVKNPDDNLKKPIGGVSLFGTNKHTENIGAAILKRNRRKSSTSGDESNTEEVKAVKEAKPVKEVQEVKKERDIFDDLFAKSEKLNNKNAKKEVAQPKADIKPIETKKKDMFSDIFDDIDDIFSSDIVNVQVKETKKNEKSLFSDDDDLFAEISSIKKDSPKKKVEKSDLFSDVAPKVDEAKCNEKTDLLASVPTKVKKPNIKKENEVVKEIKETKSLFDSDSDDGLFTNVAKDVKQNISKTEKPVEYKLKDDLFDDDEDDSLFGNNSKSKVVAINIKKVTEVSKKALFDSDDELFKDTKINEVRPNIVRQNSDVVANINQNNDQFVASVNKAVKETEKLDITNSVANESNDLVSSREIHSNPTVIDSINNDLFSDDIPPPLSKKELTSEATHDSFDDEESNIPEPIIDKNETTILRRDSKNKVSGSDGSNDIFNKSNEQPHFNENQILRTTRIASDDVKIPTAAPDKDSLNDSDEDLFRSKPKTPSERVSHKDSVSKPIAPQTPELFTTPSNKNDIFSDIFDDVPPVFEKPKEPKKSKNVNALFDDDSDDEALFFKKNDIITDEKPDLSPSEERFGIFNDEPPAIDIDFTQKQSKKEEVIHSQESADVPPAFDKTDDFLPEPAKTDNIVGKLIEKNDAMSQESQDTTDNTSKEPKKVGKLKPMNININVNSLLPGASPKKKQIENIDVKQEQTASNEELHKTVKIEPKMVKSISFDDPEILDNKMSKERAKIQVKRRPSTRRARREAVRKSAIDLTDSSFDSSNDNSTKDEVKEKIIKTVYILNDDDIFGTAKTNNESTEHKKKYLNIVDSDEELFKKPDQNIDKPSRSANNIQQAFVKRESSFESDDNNIFNKPSHTSNIANDEIDTATSKVTSEDTPGNVDILNAKKTKEVNSETVSNSPENKSFLDSDDSDDLFRQADKKPSKTNVVNEPYLDSDEELFKNTKTIQKIKETKPFVNSDDDDNLFKTKNTREIKPVLKANISSDEEDLFKTKGIATLGQVYKAETVVKEHNIFDDFPAKIENEDNNSNREVTSSKTVTKVEDTTVKDVEKPKKSILDDLSDEDDLFKGRTKLVNKKDTSLFGDDGDTDDLFGTKTVKEVKPEPVPVSLPTKEQKAAEPVFVDPLSLFGDDD